MCPRVTSELAFAHISGWLQESQCRNAWTSIWDPATNSTPHHCHAARSPCQLWQVPRSVSENSSSISRISLKRNARVWEFSSHGEDLQELPSCTRSVATTK